MPRRRVFCLLFLCMICTLTVAETPKRHAEGYRVIHTYPHDDNAFTQGLIYLDRDLYESTGLNGRSSVRTVDLASGRVLQHFDLASTYFGEGLTAWGNTLVQLTWTTHIGFIYDRSSLALLRTFHYAGEGWGLTHDDKALILSDGTSSLRFLDPQSFQETRRISVTDSQGHTQDRLNELEYIHGEIYANVWDTDEIVHISPRTGKILGRIDLSGLNKSGNANPDAVLNGIAYDPKTDRIFVTGKLWPKLFEIKVVPARLNVH